MARLPLCKGCILTSRPSEQTDRGNVSLKREQSEDAVLVLLIFKYTPQEFTAQTLPGISTLWVLEQEGFLTDVTMEKASWWLGLCALGILAAPCRGTSPCMHGSTINVILLEDEFSSWSLKYVKGEILKAIEKDKALNSEGKT